MNRTKLELVLEAVDRASAPLRRVEGVLAKITNTASIGKRGLGDIGNGMKKAARGVALGAGMMTAAYGGAALAAGQLVDTASQFEKFQTILETTEGSSAKAEKAMQWVADFAVKTPYELDTVMDSFVRLRAYGLDPTSGMLEKLGDTSAAMGKPLIQAVEAMADAVTGENERLKEFGITARKTGKTISYEYTNALGKTVSATVEAGDRLAIQQTLMTIWGDKYGGAMEKLSKTWAGMVANLGDLWLKFQLMIMQSGLFDWMKGRLQLVLDTINQMQADGRLLEWATQIGQTIQSALVGLWNFSTAAYTALSEFASLLKTASGYVGGWRNLAIIIGSIAFAPTLLATASGLFMIARGLLFLGTSATGLAAGGALRGVGLAVRSIGGSGMLAGRSVMLFGRAIMTLGGGSVWAIGAALKGLGTGIVALPSLLTALAVGMKSAAVAAFVLPGRLLAAARALVVMSAGAVRALPALLMGVARSLLMMGAGAVRTLPVLLMGVARSMLAMAAAGLRNLPATLMSVTSALARMAVTGLAALPGLLASAGSAFMALGAAMMATPIGWIVAGVAAVAGSAYLIYKNWGQIGPWFAALWAGVKQKFSDFSNWLSSFDWMPNMNVAAIVDTFKGWFDFEWADILPEWNIADLLPGSETLAAARDRLGGFFSGLNPFGGQDDALPPNPPVANDNVPNLAPVKAAQADVDALGVDIAAVTAQANGMPATVRAAMNAVRLAADLDLTPQGRKIMDTLAAGMRARAQAVVNEIKAVTQQVRDHLPSSPAKTGPLSDIHRLKFGETIAQSIRAQPMVKAMDRAAALTRAAANFDMPAPSGPNVVGIRSRTASVGDAGSAPGAGLGGGSTISVDASLTIQGNVAFATDADKGEFEALLKRHSKAVAEAVDAEVERRARLAF